MTANYLVCNIEGTNKRAEYKIKKLLFLFPSESIFEAPASKLLCLHSKIPKVN